MLVNRGMGGGLNAPGFWLELADAGAGAVNTTPSLASGSPTPTFTRATNAWTKLSSGLWASVATGIARSSYIGLTTAVGAYGGYLAEGARTQLVTPTASIRDMTDASWIKVTMNAAKTATGIDGVINSATTITAAGANSTILQTLVAAATSRTNSCWVRRKTGTGTVILKQGTATLDFTALINSSTYTLVQLNDSELNVAYGIQINTNGDELDVDFNQFEAGTFASSPIDNTGARNADVLTYALAGNIVNTVGAAYAELSTLFSIADPTTTPVALRSGGTILGVATSAADTTIFERDGTTSLTKSGLTAMSTGIRKRACSWGSGMSITGDGAVVATSAFDGDMNFSTALGVGCDGATNTLQWYGTVKNVRIWKTQLSDGQLVSIT